MAPMDAFRYLSAGYVLLVQIAILADERMVDLQLALRQTPLGSDNVHFLSGEHNSGGAFRRGSSRQRAFWSGYLFSCTVNQDAQV